MGLTMVFCASQGQTAGKIVHDVEYYILEARNGDKWAAKDKVWSYSGDSDASDINFFSFQYFINYNFKNG